VYRRFESSRPSQLLNLSLSVWLLEGFMHETPVAYEEAALIDGCTRFQAFRKVVLPQTGIASECSGAIPHAADVSERDATPRAEPA
jgi:ABC-type sulfate transport system permease component